QEPAAQWRCVRGVKMGTQRTELFRRRRTSWPQYSRVSRLSRLGGHGAQPARRKRLKEDVEAGRRRACCRDAGNAGPAVVRQRGAAEADAEAVITMVCTDLGHGWLFHFRSAGKQCYHPVNW